MEVIRWIIYVGLTIGMAAMLWSAFGKRTEVSDYAKGSTHNESSFTINESPFSFPCGKFITYEPNKPAQVKKQ